MFINKIMKEVVAFEKEWKRKYLVEPYKNNHQRNFINLLSVIFETKKYPIRIKYLPMSGKTHNTLNQYD